MNREIVGAIAELIAAIGVIVSLVYLATRIRQSTAAVRASTSGPVRIDEVHPRR